MLHPDHLGGGTDDCAEQTPYYTRIDRGRAEFFHGREAIRDRFQSLLNDARQLKQGTTFLIQGAPGAGKSALMHQMCEESEGWKVARIGSQELWSPVAMAQALGKSYTLNKDVAGTVGIKFFELGGVKRVAGDASPTRILQRLSHYSGVILLLDEAQKLRKLLPQNIEVAVDTLDAIHNGELEKPVMLLTAGLGIAKSVYKALDVSRFADGCINYLVCLNLEAERNVIRDWLTIAGGAQGDPTDWIHAIADRSHGWPQHIICYARRAKDLLIETCGEMTHEGLQEVLAQGDQARNAYYAERVSEMPEEDIQIIANVFSAIDAGETVSKKDITNAIEEAYSREEAEKMFNDLLLQGVIARTANAQYDCPIPSFRAWLAANYGHAVDKEMRGRGLSR